jgi:N-methylhydantoinase A/oxoprolinase/acetone carboxylase beta subunit
MEEAFERMETEGGAALAGAASAHAGTEFERAVEMRYYGQSFELTIGAPGGKADDGWMKTLVEGFHAAHQRAYGFRVDSEPVEIVNLRSTTVGKIKSPEMRRIEAGDGNADGAIKSTRLVYFAPDGVVDTPVYDRTALKGGAAFAGPAVVEERDSTLVVLPGWGVRVDAFGNLVVSR